jgi:hypothetical protein
MFKNYAYNLSYYASDKVGKMKEKSKEVVNKIQEKYSN